MIRVRPYRHDPTRFEYDVRVRLPNGEVFRERRVAPVRSKSAAEHYAQHVLADALRTGRKSVAAAPPTFDELQTRYQTWCAARQNRGSTLESKETIYRKHLQECLGGLRIDEVTQEHVDELKAAFIGNPSTANNILTVLNTMLECAVDYKLIAAKPVKIVWLKRRRPRIDFYDFDQYARLSRCAAQICHRTALLVLLGGDAALRRGEIIALEQTDIDYERGLITIERQERRGRIGPPKGGVIATIPTTRRLLDALRSYRHLRGPRVFYDASGNTITESHVRRWLARAQRRANLKEKGAHILRHTAISLMVMQGADVRAVQEFARHANLQTTMRYMHLSPGHLRRAVELLEVPPSAGAKSEQRW